TNWSSYSLSVADAAPGSHTLTFSGTNSDASYSAYLDNVKLAVDGVQSSAQALNQLIPPPSSGDQKSWHIYDAAGRLEYAVSGSGQVTQDLYDGASNLIQTTTYANPIDVSAFGSAPAATDVTVVPDAVHDQVARKFYDAAGNLAATLSVTGQLVQYFYDGANQITEKRVYAQAPNSALRASATLDQLTA